MAGQVYIKRDVRINLLPTKHRDRYVKEINFECNLRPRVSKIVPLSRNDSNDAKLAEHLEYLYGDKHKGIMEQVQITGHCTAVCGETKDRQMRIRRSLGMDYLTVMVKGTFPWFVRVECGRSIRFKVKIQNLFSGEENQEVDNQLVELKQECVRANAPFENSIKFKINDDTWDTLFGEPTTQPGNKTKRFPKLSLVLCADFSERMAQPVPLIFPFGTGYKLTLYMKQAEAKRRQEIERGKQTNAVIIGKGGKKWQVHEEYLVEASPVFRAMLQTEFEESQTKTIKLDDLDDEVIECFIGYLHFFELDVCVHDFGLKLALLALADRYQVDSLQTAAKKLLLRKQNKCYDIGEALNIYVFTRQRGHFETLKEKALKILKHHEDKVEESPEMQEFFVQFPKVALELFSNVLMNI